MRKDPEEWTDDEVRHAVAKYKDQKGAVEDEQETLKDIADGMDRAGLNKDAVKLCLKLRDLDARDQSSFLRSLDRLREVFNLGAQYDLEDAIKTTVESAVKVMTPDKVVTMKRPRGKKLDS